jgi:y4mF family transcriptional regulator
MLPIGNFKWNRQVKYTTQQIGRLVKERRKALAITQQDLALASDTGLRFIIELEKGKPTCQIGKVLTVLHTLGIGMQLDGHAKPGAKERGDK